MIYTLIIQTNHLTNGRNALTAAKALIANGHKINCIYFLFNGTCVANKFIDMPSDEYDLTGAWAAFAAQANVELFVCSASGFRRGIVADTIASEFAFGSIGQLVEFCEKANCVLNLGTDDITLDLKQNLSAGKSNPKKKYLIIMQQNPYENSLSMEGFEFACALTAFEQNVSLLFRGDAVKQLLSNQPKDKVIAKDFTKAYAGLDMFGIEDVYVDQTSMTIINNQEMILQPQIVDEIKTSELLNKHDVVITI